MEDFKFILTASLIFGLLVVYPILVIFQKRKDQKRIRQERKQMEEMLSIYEAKGFDYGTDWKERMAEYRRQKPKVEFKEKTFNEIKRYEKERKIREFEKCWVESDN